LRWTFTLSNIIYEPPIAKLLDVVGEHAIVRAGFRVEPFAAAAGWSRAHCYNLMSGKVAGAPPLPFIKSGKARIITISPADYLALCAQQAGA
jgi:hypothetical protein